MVSRTLAGMIEYDGFGMGISRETADQSGVIAPFLPRGEFPMFHSISFLPQARLRNLFSFRNGTIKVPSDFV